MAISGRIRGPALGGPPCSAAIAPVLRPVDGRVRFVSVVAIESLDQLRVLVEHVLDTTRTEPVVCVTTRQGSASPLLDVEALAEAVGTLPVYVLPTGELSWELNAALPEQFEVYGGASRIWWPGLLPSDNPRLHPLIFCWAEYEAPSASSRILRELARWGWDIEDDRLLPVGPVATSPIRTAYPVPLKVEGALAGFGLGDVVEARVAAVHLAAVEVELPGGTHVLIRHRRGRPAPSYTSGDVVRVEIVTINALTGDIEARWAAEPEPMRRTIPSPAEFARQHRPTGDQAAMPETKDMLSDEARLERLRDQARKISESLSAELAQTRSRIQEFAAENLTDVFAALEQDLVDARGEARSLRLQLAAAEDDKRNAIAEMRKHRERANEAEKQNRRERDRRIHAEDLARGRGAHDDPETQLRHEISLACGHLSAELGRDAEQSREFVLGPDFLNTLASLQGIARVQIVEKIAGLLVGAPNSHGHVMRSAEGGNSPQRIRASDGAKAFRLYLQRGSHSARRLHYWQLGDGTIELANVGVHDDIVIR